MLFSGRRVARLNRCFLTTGNRRVPSANTFRRQNVTTLAVRVLNQCDMGTAVRIVLETLNYARNTVLVALEVDNPVTLFVTAALMTNRNATVALLRPPDSWFSCQPALRAACPCVRPGVSDRYLESPSCGRRF